LLTIETFDNWLYDRDMPVSILLCQGAAPEKIAENNSEFAKLYARVLHWREIGYINLARDGEKWMLLSRLVPKR
jgi:hypothetical protein